MKIVVNKCFGSFKVNMETVKKLNLETPWDLECECDRTNSALIELMESGFDVNSDVSELVVVEIPDEATDYKIVETDGYEQLFYVLDGKIKTA